MRYVPIVLEARQKKLSTMKRVRRDFQFFKKVLLAEVRKDLPGVKGACCGLVGFDRTRL